MVIGRTSPLPGKYKDREGYYDVVHGVFYIYSESAGWLESDEFGNPKRKAINEVLAPTPTPAPIQEPEVPPVPSKGTSTRSKKKKEAE